MQTNSFLIASNFVIYPHILIFSVFNVASLSPYWLPITFSMWLFFYLFLFAISLWHPKFVTAVFVNNQHGIQRWGENFDKKFVFEGVTYTAERWTDEFPEKSWTKRGVNKLKKLWDTGTVDRRPGSGRPRSAHTEENTYAFVCLDISDILLTHKYTQHTQLHAYSNKVGALKIQFVCIFSISAEYLQKIWIY